MIAEKLGTTQPLVSRALRARHSEAADREVARVIGVRPQDIWPSRYDKFGNRLRYRALSEAGR